jgi:hypothetical protein
LDQPTPGPYATFCSGANDTGPGGRDDKESSCCSDCTSLNGITYAAETSSTVGMQRPSAADLNSLTDMRVGIVKAALQLTPDQEKYWPAVEEAIRARAKNRQARLERVAELRDRGSMEAVRDRNPVELMQRRADALTQRAADLKKLADAWDPLYKTLVP